MKINLNKKTGITTITEGNYSQKYLGYAEKDAVKKFKKYIKDEEAKNKTIHNPRNLGSFKT